MTDMVKQMAYLASEGTPWHGKGTPMADGTDDAAWIAAAGYDFDLELAPIAYKPNGHWHPATEYAGVYRHDTDHLFGIASQRYKIHQPRDLWQIMKDVAASAGLHVATAGTLFGGEKIWMLASGNKTITVAGSDKIKPHLMLSTSLVPGVMATRAGWTGVRVVCWNTFSMALNQDGADMVTVRHVSDLDADSIKSRIGAMEDRADSFEAAANRLAERKPTRAEVDNLLLQLFGKRDDDDKPLTRGNLTTQSANVIREVEHQIVQSPGSNVAPGSAYQVWNGVTHYVDYKARARQEDNRTDSAWFGKGNAIKSAALSSLLTQSIDRTFASSFEAVLAATPQ